jgi:hypothetical protein
MPVKGSGPRHNIVIIIPIPCQLSKGAGLYIRIEVITRAEDLKDIQ